MKYIKTFEANYHPVINDYVAVRETSPKYKMAKNKIYQITLWNSENYFLSDLFDIKDNIGWVSWGEVRHLNDKELKKLDLLQNVRKYNL